MFTQSDKKLFEPVTAGAWNLRTRTAMAPMTRCFADDETGEVNDSIAEYYRKRAADGIGLIITEGVVVTKRGKGNPGVPGLYADEQIAGWRKVTEAVHAEGGLIIPQIWHVGRVTHSELTGGFPPQAPSAIRAEGNVARFRKPYDEPEAMTKEDIATVIRQFKEAAKRALEAGFDGVEIHGAHGYLIDQFASDVTNHRTDEYGGNLRGRLTFMKEVLQNVMEVVGPERTLIRFSALKIDRPDYMWADPEEALATFAEMFKEIGVKMIHPSTMAFTQPLKDGQTMHQLMRKYWKDTIVGVGNLDPETAEQALLEGTIDIAAIGRPLIANPSYLHDLAAGKPLDTYDAKEHLGTLV